MKLLIALILVAIITSCHSSEHHRNSMNSLPLERIRDTSKEFRTRELDSVIAFLKNTSEVYLDLDRFDGTRNESYLCFQRLQQTVSDSTLLKMTYHSAPNIRMYAMLALINKNKTMALKRFKSFKRDTSLVSYHSGDVITIAPLGLLIEYHFDSTDLNKNN